ncbi:MAG TPA: hypothetical protein VFR31_11990 [Thermoanaerobaculia bacterium]|nr:hypothetical protein [Thermoanaerobaculia bacterium]
MSEDRILRELGRLAREEEEAESARLDERWDRLAAGTLTADEEAELRALAETSPGAREAWEAFRPLGPDFQARMVEQIAAELPKKEGKVLPFRPAVRIGGWIAAAAAAVLAVVLLRPAPPLPDYEVAVSGGTSEMRSGPAETFLPGDSVEVVLRPQTETSGSLEARLYLLHGDDLRLLETRSEVADPGGSFKIKGTLDPDLRPGTWTLWAVVGRPGDLPDPKELRLQEGRRRDEDWIAVSTDIRIRPRGP